MRVLYPLRRALVGDSLVGIPILRLNISKASKKGYPSLPASGRQPGCKYVTANPNAILSQTSNTGILLQDSPTYTPRSSRPLEETIIGQRRWGLSTPTFGWAFLSPYTRPHGQLGITAVPTSSGQVKPGPPPPGAEKENPARLPLVAAGVRSKTETSAEVPGDPSRRLTPPERTLTGQDQAHVSRSRAMRIHGSLVLAA